jgi:hypothetical protein
VRLAARPIVADTSGVAGPVRSQTFARRLGAVCLALALLLALPATTTARALAEPVTIGDWMRVLFVTPDRKLDASHDGLAWTPPPPPAPQVQTSSEPAAPAEPAARTEIPRLWLRRDSRRTGRRRRR